MVTISHALMDVSRPRSARLRSIPDRVQYTIYALALAVAISVWFIAIRAPLWLDETVSIYLIQGGFAGIMSRHVLPDAPAYSCLLWLSTKAMGRREIALRISSLLPMLGAACLLYSSARELFDRDVALIAAIVFCLHPIITFASIDIRPYAFAALAINSSILAPLHLRHSSSNWLAALFGLSAACIVQFQLLFAVILPALAVCFVVLKSDDRVAYSIVTLPLIRRMIDCFYNITAMLADPMKGFQFRASGYKQTLAALESDEKRYGGDPSWDAYIASRRKQIGLSIRVDGLTVEQVKNAKIWPTLSAYLRVKKNVPLTPHQSLLKKLTYGMWQEYSGMAHGTFQGLMPTAMFYLPKPGPDSNRESFEDISERAISMHIARVAAILLCIVSEVQASFQFEGASINHRLHQVWNALISMPEIGELYDDRYARLMKDRGIHP